MFLSQILRISLSQWYAVGLIAVALASESVWVTNEGLEESMMGIGALLVIIACLGRIWCIAHIAGRKTDQLVAEGPYSLCRNPLYLFSFIGAIGVGLSTCTLVIPLAVAIGFLLLYPGVIHAEEHRLAQVHGEAFAAYCRNVPRMIPSFRHYAPARHISVDMRLFGRGLCDAGWFLLAVMVAHMNIEFHEWGYLPTLARLY